MREHEGGDHDGQQVRQQHRRRRRRAAMPGRMGWAPVTDQGEDTEVVGAGMHSAGVDPGGVAPSGATDGAEPVAGLLARGVVQHPEEGVHEHLAHPQRRDGAPGAPADPRGRQGQRQRHTGEEERVGRGDDAPAEGMRPDGEQDAGRARHEGARHPDPPCARRHHGSIVANCPGRARPGSGSAERTPPAT